MTTPPESTDELVAFLDANIVLEGKPVAELPWTEIATAGLIRALIVPKAMEGGCQSYANRSLVDGSPS